MSLKANIAANYASQVYTTLIGIALVPLYLRHMGSEAYGLVGFFAMLQAWFSLLDLGLTPTISRESARYQGGAMGGLEFRRVFRALAILFLGIATAGAALLLGFAEPISHRWLNVGQLPRAEVLLALQIMAVCVALRWAGGLYRGVVSGCERLVWLSGFNAVIATLRFVGVLVSMSVWGHTPTVFFLHQLAVAGAEALGLLWACYRLLPTKAALGEPVGWSLRPVIPMLRFSLSIALTSSVWVLVTQADKLLLSGVLTLSDFGYFSTAVLVAGGITLLTGPISTSIMPRMARLFAEGRPGEVLGIYSKSTQLVAMVAGTAATTMAWCAMPLMYAWTGSREIAANTVDVLRLYAIGNGLLAISAFPFYLQYARGSMKLHVVGSCLLGLVLVPAVLLAATQLGAVGAGIAWTAVNALYLLLWVAYAHARLAPGLHWRWLRDDVLAVMLPPQALGALVLLVPATSLDRAQAAALTLTFAAGCLLLSAAGSSTLRRAVSAAWRDRALRGA